MDEEMNGGLTADETSYFESGGEKIAPSLGGEGEAGLDEAQTEQTTLPEGTEAEQTGADKKGSLVPHGAFHAEREEHKKTKAELEAVNQRLAVLDDRWNTLLAVKDGKPTEAEPEANSDAAPDPEQDLVGYLKWLAGQNKAVQEQSRQREQEEQSRRAEAEVWNTWDSAVTHARTIRPDFDKATDFLADLRFKQLEALAVVDPRFVDPQARIGQINGELREIIASAAKGGKNPAQVVYEMAHAYGYKPDAVSGGATSDPKDTHQQTLDKIAALDEAQRASKTLGASGGTNSGDPMTAEAIAAMSPSEFDAWYRDPKNVRIYDKILGDNA